MGNREHYLKAFLIGGLAMGVLSAAPVTGCCCCIWVILGGGLAGYILCRSAARPVSSGEGGLVGLFSGLIGGMIFSLAKALQPIDAEQIRMAMQEQMSRQGVDVPPELEQLMNQAMGLLAQPGLIMGLTAFFSLILFAIIGILGAMIAIAIFEPRFAPLRAMKMGTYVQPAPGPLPGPRISSVQTSLTQQPSVQEPKEVSAAAPQTEEPELYFPRKPKEDQ